MLNLPSIEQFSNPNMNKIVIKYNLLQSSLNQTLHTKLNQILTCLIALSTFFKIGNLSEKKEVTKKKDISGFLNFINHIHNSF